MKEITLAKGRGVVLVDNEDFAALAAWSWSLHCRGYAQRSDRALMHRIIMAAPRGVQVDHVNGNRLDNTRANLRVCTPSQNTANGRRRRGSNPYKGIWFAKKLGRWRAAITVGGVVMHLGCFERPEDAATSYDSAARERFGAFARLNFPRDGEQAA